MRADSSLFSVSRGRINQYRMTYSNIRIVGGKGTSVQENITADPQPTNICSKRYQPHLSHTNMHPLCGQSLEMHSMHSYAAAAAFREKQRRKRKAEYGHKAHLYTTWRYLTFQFDLNDTWLSREVQREQVCVSLWPSEEEKQLGRS